MTFYSNNHVEIIYDATSSTQGRSVVVCEIPNFTTDLYIYSFKKPKKSQSMNLTSPVNYDNLFAINLDKFKLVFTDLDVATKYFKYIIQARGQIYKDIKFVYPELFL